MPVSARASITISGIRSLASNMDFSTPSVRAATGAEIAPVAAGPAANMLAEALMVEATSEIGTPADAASWESTAAASSPHLRHRPGRSAGASQRGTASPDPSSIVRPSCPRAGRVDGPPAGGFFPPGRTGRWRPGTSRVGGPTPGPVARLQIVPGETLFGSFWVSHGPHPLLPCAPLCQHRPCLHCRLVSHAVQPVRHHLSLPDRHGLPDQDEEGCLEGVLGVVMMTQNAATDAPDHRAVPLHERL